MCAYTVRGYTGVGGGEAGGSPAARVGESGGDPPFARVEGLGFGVKAPRLLQGLRVHSLGLRVQGLGFRLQGSGSWASRGAPRLLQGLGVEG